MRLFSIGKKSGGKSAAPKTNEVNNIKDDEVTVALARACQDNTSAARMLESALSELLDTNSRLKNGVYRFNAPLNQT